MLHGGNDELAAVTALLQRTRAGNGGAVVVRGAEGAGKTTLLTEALWAARGLTVLQTAGPRGGGALPYTALRQLLATLHPRIGRLPHTRAQALRIALGLAPGAADRAVVAAAACALVTIAAREQPVVLLVDDAHWLDAASAAVVGYIAGRAEGLPIAVLRATRERVAPAGDARAAQPTNDAAATSPAAATPAVTPAAGGTTVVGDADAGTGSTDGADRVAAEATRRASGEGESAGPGADAHSPAAERVTGTDVFWGARPDEQSVDVAGEADPRAAGADDLVTEETFADARHTHTGSVAGAGTETESESETAGRRLAAAAAREARATRWVIGGAASAASGEVPIS
ncbi:ATP-binding protein, partial [Streptomyces sp. SID3343]|uniref:AAA family ATPase n=1 Tax=Streptomyces sp. SID3343 TaxID=2690260 RepID=UPI00136B8063|nr:AAA family ATPase [Streptomyces sp. SID3343]